MKRFGLLLFCVLLLSGCSLKYNMKEPSLSSVEYSNSHFVAQASPLEWH